MKRQRWVQALDALLLFFECVILVRLLTVHPSGEKGFDAAVRVAGQTLLGLLISGSALAFAVSTRKTLNMQRWFALLSAITTLGWVVLFGLASVAV